MAVKFIPFAVLEALDACLEYCTGRCHFDNDQRRFVYTGSGWGSPMAMLRMSQNGTGDRADRNAERVFKNGQLRSAVQDGVLEVRAKKVPHGKGGHVKIPASNFKAYELGLGGEILLNSAIIYTDATLTPSAIAALNPKNQGGRPSYRDKILRLHETYKTRITTGMKQRGYAAILLKAFEAEHGKKDGISNKVICDYLRKAKILTKKKP